MKEPLKSKPDPDPTADESALIEQARQGGAAGQRAYGVLVERYRSSILRLITRLLGRSDDAEDVAQDAFVRAYLALVRYPSGAAFWPWMRTIAVRLAYNHRRDSATRRRYEQQAVDQEPARTKLAEREAMDRALGVLSYPHREVLILRHVEGMSIQELAQELDIGVSAAKMRLSRAREHFQAEFKRLSK